MFKNKIVLVTGGTGFIGSHIVDKCLAENAEKVIAFDNLIGSKTSNVNHITNKPDLKDRFQFIKGDVADVKAINPLVKEADIIFHEAASKLVVSLKNPRIDMHTNIIGTFNILEAAQQSDKRIIHASTGSVLGSSDKPMKEDDNPRPTTAYGISKLAAEKYCQFYAKEYGVKVCVLRYFHVFGPRQDYSGEAGVINIFLSRVLQGKPPVIYSGGKQIRCFTYVSDDVDANLLLLKNKKTIGEIYNVASRTRMSVNELAHIIIKKYAKAKNKDMKPVMGEHRMGENFRPIPDTSKIEKLGFKEKVSFKDGLEITKQWIAGDIKKKGKKT
ncbi:SDR family NAD(P)-dependent oxidoreductase [Candidatus Woesearchaeota archaeon]|nr:SDR family NAD(P)-dependent oxidoreductase [Candidatus Woesearchaeota archaeon]